MTVLSLLQDKGGSNILKAMEFKLFSLRKIAELSSQFSKCNQFYIWEFGFGE